MSYVTTTDAPNRATRIARWLGFGVPGLLLIACIAGVGWFVFPFLFPKLWANQISRSQGKVELLAGAGEQLDFGRLSPDGRWMVLHPLANHRDQQLPFVLDLTTKETWPFNITVYDIRWLDATHFVVCAVSGNLYNVIDTGTHSITPINAIPKADYQKTGGLNIILSMLDGSDRVYVLESFGEDAGYKIIVRKGGKWQIFNLGYGYELGITREKLEGWVTQPPHIDVPRHARISDPVTRKHTFSPDGQFYVTTEVADNADVNARAAIYTRNGQLVASAYKAGWTPYVLGWAHDGSGVYMHFVIAGSAASMLAPYVPLFKLSPYTAEEQRRQTLIRVGAWALGIVMVAGVGWGWVVWRRRR